MKSFILKSSILVLCFFFFISGNTYSQEKKENPFKMETVKMLETSPVKNQASTSTCWSFGTISMLESELLRMGKGLYDLSEMFIVRHTYIQKAIDYLRFSGKNHFAAGGAQHDVINVWKKYGIVPDKVYSGLKDGATAHNHGELNKTLTGFVNLVLESRLKFPHWKHAFQQTVDAYLGRYPRKFEYVGREYTPKSFAEELGINPDDYIEFSSYTHHPFYEKFALEVVDNWAHNTMYNVPLDELMEIMENAIMEGYTISWAADISDLKMNEGVAIVPADKSQKYGPGPELEITQKIRQNHFDNWTLTDDHCMHLCGIAKDQTGKKYFMEKNSWGIRGEYKGFSYMSEEFMKLRTMSIMVHKDAVPREIARKIRIIH